MSLLEVIISVMTVIFFLFLMGLLFYVYQRVSDKISYLGEKIQFLEQTSNVRQQEINEQIKTFNQDASTNFHKNWQETHAMLNKIGDKLHFINDSNKKMVELSSEMSTLTSILDNKQKRGITLQ